VTRLKFTKRSLAAAAASSKGGRVYYLDHGPLFQSEQRRSLEENDRAVMYSVFAIQDVEKAITVSEAGTRILTVATVDCSVTFITNAFQCVAACSQVDVQE